MTNVDGFQRVPHNYSMGSMTTLALETEPFVNQVTVTDEKLIVELTDGSSLIVPLAMQSKDDLISNELL